MSDSDNTPFGFGRFVPGFDFLQNLAKGASSGVSAMPGLTSWVAPTVSVEELEKRIGELKSVQFWLEQNTRALAATVQALEVQKMTLATLENMNVAMGDMAGAFGTKMADVTGGAQKFAETFATPKAKAEPAAPAHESAQPQAAAAAAADKKQKSAAEGGGAGGAAAFMPGASGLADPVQWWTSLTNQFQQIAASAMRDVSQHAANAPAGAAAGSGAANDALKAASDMASQFAAQSMKGAQEMTRTAMEAATQATKVAKATAAPAAKKAAAKAAAPAKKTAAAAAKKPAASKPRSSK